MLQDMELDSEESWLYSPPKEADKSLVGTPIDPDAWLKQDAMTADLMRVRSSLAEKLELIAIEKIQKY